MKQSKAKFQLQVFLKVLKMTRKHLSAELKGAKRGMAAQLLPYLLDANGDKFVAALEQLVKADYLLPLDFYNVCYIANRHLMIIQMLIISAGFEPLPDLNASIFQFQSWDAEISDNRGRTQPTKRSQRRTLKSIE